MGGSYRLRKNRNAKFRSAYAQRNPRGLLSTYTKRPRRPLQKQRSPFAAYPLVNWRDAVDNKRADPFDPVDRQWKMIKKDFPLYGTHKRHIGQIEYRGEKYFRRRPRLTKALTSVGGHVIEPLIGQLIDKILMPAHQARKKRRTGDA